jgi:hypothetical protein
MESDGNREKQTVRESAIEVSLFQDVSKIR